MKTTKKVFRTPLLLMAALASQYLMAQPGPPADPTPLPGIVWLVAAGAALGGKKLWDKRKEQEKA